MANFSSALEELRNKIEKQITERLNLSQRQKQQLYLCSSEMLSIFPIKVGNFNSFLFSKKVETAIISKLNLSKIQKEGLESIVTEIVDITDKYLKAAASTLDLINLL